MTTKRDPGLDSDPEKVSPVSMEGISGGNLNGMCRLANGSVKNVNLLILIIVLYNHVGNPPFY